MENSRVIDCEQFGIWKDLFFFIPILQKSAQFSKGKYLTVDVLIGVI